MSPYKSPPHVCIIILNWNRCQDTLDCLHSIDQLSYPNYSVILVDNASTDETVPQVRAKFPQVQIIVNPKNLGFAAGSNVGLRRALKQKTDYVLLLNNDTKVATNLVDALIEACQEEVAVPKIYYHNDRHRIWSAGATWRQWPPRVTIIGFNQPDDGSFDQPCSLEYATGCAMLIHRSVFEQVGLLDEAFFMYQEDYEFCYRVRQAGVAIRYVPTAMVWHKVSVSTGEDSPQKWRLWSESVVIFYRKRYQWYHIPLLAFTVWVIFREISKGKFQFLGPMFSGIYQGLTRQQTHHA